jgi:hypothetical protein
MKKKILSGLFALALLTTVLCISSLCSCHQKDGQQDEKSIPVNLESNKDVSLFDLFSKVEIIPIETNDPSLISHVDKLIVSNDTLFILDSQMAKLLAFDGQGKYLYQIGNKGKGPGEYTMASDFDVHGNTITLLSAIENKLFLYDKQGNFITSHRLPTIKGACIHVKNLNNDTVALWTHDYDNRLKFYSKSAEKIIKELIEETDNVFTNLGSEVFAYESYLFLVHDNRVFTMNDHLEVEEAYRWDFGKLNNTPKMIENAPVVKSRDDFRNIIDRLRSSEIVNYYFIRAGGNARYTYTKLNRENRHLNIFHDKSTKKVYLFEQTTEKVKLFPLFWTNDYLIGFIPDIISDINITIPDEILDSDNIQKKNVITEDDNPVLIKYFFKTSEGK